MLSLRVEPLVVDLLQLSCLFQAGILIVDGIYQILVIAYQAQLARWYVRDICHQTVESELLQFPLNGNLSPEEIVVCASLYTCQCVFW